MPKVGKKTFEYTKKGVKAAKSYAKKMGVDMEGKKRMDEAVKNVKKKYK